MEVCTVSAKDWETSKQNNEKKTCWKLLGLSDQLKQPGKPGKTVGILFQLTSSIGLKYCFVCINRWSSFIYVLFSIVLPRVFFHLAALSWVTGSPRSMDAVALNEAINEFSRNVLFYNTWIILSIFWYLHLTLVLRLFIFSIFSLE